MTNKINKIIIGDKFDYDLKSALYLRLNIHEIKNSRNRVDLLSNWLSTFFSDNLVEVKSIIDNILFELLENSVEYGIGEEIKLDIIEDGNNIFLSITNDIQTNEINKFKSYIESIYDESQNIKELFKKRSLDENHHGGIGLLLMKNSFNGKIKFIIDNNKLKTIVKLNVQDLLVEVEKNI